MEYFMVVGNRPCTHRNERVRGLVKWSFNTLKRVLWVGHSASSERHVGVGPTDENAVRPETVWTFQEKVRKGCVVKRTRRVPTPVYESWE